MRNDHHRLGRPGSATDTPLPPDRAFVVQLRTLGEPGGEVLVGRVEHIASGAVGRFASAAELTAFIAQIGRSASPGSARTASAGEQDATADDV